MFLISGAKQDRHIPSCNRTEDEAFMCYNRVVLLVHSACQLEHDHTHGSNHQTHHDDSVGHTHWSNHIHNGSSNDQNNGRTRHGDAGNSRHGMHNFVSVCSHSTRNHVVAAHTHTVANTDINPHMLPRAAAGDNEQSSHKCGTAAMTITHNAISLTATTIQTTTSTTRALSIAHNIMHHRAREMMPIPVETLNTIDNTIR